MRAAQRCAAAVWAVLRRAASGSKETERSACAEHSAAGAGRAARASCSGCLHDEVSSASVALGMGPPHWGD